MEAHGPASPASPAGNSLNTSTDHAAAGTQEPQDHLCRLDRGHRRYLTKNFSPNYISGDIYIRFYVFLPTGFESANCTLAFYTSSQATADNETGAELRRVQLMNGAV